MFARRISIQRIDASGQAHPCPIRQIDNFAMRNFTNDPVFDDTLPAADGLLEAGHRVPLDRLQSAMEDWFHRKGYLKPNERLEVRELGSRELEVFEIPARQVQVREIALTDLGQSDL